MEYSRYKYVFIIFIVPTWPDYEELIDVIINWGTKRKFTFNKNPILVVFEIQN